MSSIASQISVWGNGLALRLTKPMAKEAGVVEGTPVRVTVKPGRIVIEAETELSLDEMLAAFDPDTVQSWARGLEQELFTGTTGRVFPKAMKASPLLRAWLARLDALGVTFNTRWRWTGQPLPFHWRG